jgi:type I restriction enzyme S subunit
MSFPRYPKYKDSGVEWLGQVPEHWEVKRLKRACHVFPSNVDKKTYADETAVLLCNYTVVYYNDVITAGMEFMPATASAEQIEKFTLRTGDTIITKDSETADDIAIAAYVPADLPGVVCGYHLSMVRPLEGTVGVFVKRLFDSVYARAIFEVLANGLTRVGLGQHELDNVELPFPPAAEQSSIAAYLDRETAKIDALVAEQERLMELLKEKRQAVISHAVTKGLNPKAVLKPSGVEWLGDVPSHWKVGKCGFYISILSGFAFPSTGFTDDENDTKLLRGINVGVQQLKWDETVYWRRVEDDGLDIYEMVTIQVVLT